MRKAIIDLGTNTFNLLIAEVREKDFDVLFSTKVGVALGMGGVHKGEIAPDAFQRGIDTVRVFINQCDAWKVDQIQAFGTSAIRDARNQAEFVQALKELGNIEIHVISGDQEAHLIYQGVSWFYDFQEAGVIMDIGGGSTEFIWANQQGILAKTSLNIGVSRAYQELTFSDPFTSEDIQRLENWFDDRAGTFFDSISCKNLIGASGSFETFYEMIHNQPFPLGLLPSELELNELNKVIEWCVSSTQAERDLHPYIIPIRRKMAPIAAVKTRWVMKKLGIQKVLVSPCSLKEGALK